MDASTFSGGIDRALVTGILCFERLVGSYEDEEEVNRNPRRLVFLLGSME